MKKAQDKNTQGEKKNAQRKSYHSPKLSNFGSVAQLTLQNGNGPASDAGNNMMAS